MIFSQISSVKTPLTHPPYFLCFQNKTIPSIRLFPRNAFVAIHPSNSFIHPSIHPFIHPCMRSFIHPSISLSIHPFIRLSVRHTPTHPSSHPCIYKLPSISPSFTVAMTSEQTLNFVCKSFNLSKPSTKEFILPSIPSFLLMTFHWRHNTGRN